jgi:hypothetical protein
VHQIKIHIVETQVLERGIESRLDIIGMMRVVPKFSGDKKFFTPNARFLDGIADRRLGSVDTRRVNVAVASFEGSCYCSGEISSSFDSHSSFHTVPGHPCLATYQNQWQGSGHLY